MSASISTTRLGPSSHAGVGEYPTPDGVPGQQVTELEGERS
nr:hypothetical protein [Rhodococcus sp. (in: high G+C Gram-positive bacteria)]